MQMHSLHSCAGQIPEFTIHTYLSDILFLLLTQGQLDEDLLQFLVAVVDDELLKAVVLWVQHQKDKNSQNLLLLTC